MHPQGWDEQPNFEPPPPALLNKYGHFHVDPTKYEPLRVPAFADRRQFLFRRYTDPETGQRFSTLQWFIDYTDAVRQYADDITLRKLFEVASIPRPLPKIRTPQSAQEFAQTYQDYQQAYQSIYQSIRQTLQQIAQLKQNADPRTAGVLIAQETLIYESLPKLINREIRDLERIFRAPQPTRRIQYTFAGAITDDQKRAIDAAFAEARKYIPQGYRVPPVIVQVRPTAQRSFHISENIILGADFFEADLDGRTEVIVHEYLHHLEKNDLPLRTATSRIYQQQTEGEPLVGLDTVLPNQGYNPNEMTRIDDFPHPYMGKDYGVDNQRLQHSTELPNMFYDLYFLRRKYITRFREIETIPTTTSSVSPQARTEGALLDQMFVPNRINNITLPLWRAIHKRPQ